MFFINNLYHLCTISHLANSPTLWYIIDRKDDTNEEVNNLRVQSKAKT